MKFPSLTSKRNIKENKKPKSVETIENNYTKSPQETINRNYLIGHFNKRSITTNQDSVPTYIRLLPIASMYCPIP